MSEICLQNVFRHYKNLNLHVTTMEAVHLSRDKCQWASKYMNRYKFINEQMKNKC